MKNKLYKDIIKVLFFLFAIQLNVVEVNAQVYIEDSGAKTFDLSKLEWKLWGYRPESWRMNFDFNNFTGNWAEFSDIPAKVPGSVRSALLAEGIIPDWNVGLNTTASEWVENRHWLFVSSIPNNMLPENGEELILHGNGLDYNGILMINDKEAGQFSNTFLPHKFNITPFLKEKDNKISFVFLSPPRYLGQIGFTSKIKDWKPRFNYGWDWMTRIVQIGVWDKVWLSIDKKGQAVMDDVQIVTDAKPNKDSGVLKIKADFNKAARKGKVKVTLLSKSGKRVFSDIISVKSILEQKTWSNLKIKRWWPNGFGEQHIYELNIELLNEKEKSIQTISRNVGFKNIQWLACEDAREDADPWICSVNNTPIFLQGVNWSPIRPNFADLKKEDYIKRLQLYKDLGVNTIRVWGGGFPEFQWLYDLSDEMGLLIWQDFPLSSSGIDNTPPETDKEVFTMSKIVKSYLNRTQHNVSILMWCAGNEIYNKENTAPLTDSHKMIAAMKEVVNTMDPLRRFVDGSPSGPSIYAGRDNFGEGVNWETHGPWQLPFTADDKSMNAVKDFWNKNDALFISEAGVPGAMSAEMIKKYAGEYNPLPASLENPIWRNVNWWVDWDDYLYDHDGIPTDSLEKYVDWSQGRQSEGLVIALKSRKDRFPKSGGFIIWMGHDSFPCMVNTSIVDFDGNPKPAAFELSKVWKDNSKFKR